MGALRGAPATAATTVNTGTTLLCNVPTNVNGDVLIMAVLYRNNGTFTGPAGWTECPHSPGTRTTTSTLHVLYRVASSEPANYTVTIGTAAQISMFIAAYTSIDNANPVDIDAFQANGSGTNMTAPTVTTTTNNGELLLICGIEATGTWTSDAAMTEQVDVTNSAGSARNALTMDDLLLGGAGATGTHTAVCTGSSPGIGYHLALKAAATGASVVPEIRFLRQQRV